MRPLSFSPLSQSFFVFIRLNFLKSLQQLICSHLILLGFPLLFLASGCSGGIASDSCAVGHSEMIDRTDDSSCNGGFFSSTNQRATLFSGDSSPRLWTGEEARKESSIDTSVINRGPEKSSRMSIGYMGPLRVEYPYDEEKISQNLQELQSIGSKVKSVDEKIALNFDRVTIDYFLKQVLSGALGLTYIAPDNLGGSISFKTEEPISKAQLIDVTRDILARNNLSMKLISGVYNIGRQELLTSIESTSAAGRSGEQTTRIIKLSKISSTQALPILKQLVPDYVSIIPTNASDTLIVRGPAFDVDKVQDLINTLSANGIGDDRIAIIPLEQSAPERVAQQLQSFYRERFPDQATSLTVLALENQQALLIGTSDRSTMNVVRRLITELDRKLGDNISLRIIPLQNLSAEDSVKQLTAIFSTADSSKNPLGPSPDSSRRASLRPPTRIPTGQTMSDEVGDSFAPGLMMNRSSGGGGGDSSGGGSSGSGSSVGNYGNLSGASSSFQSGSGGGAQATQKYGVGGTRSGGGGVLDPNSSISPQVAVRFTADTRNNAVMVYSDYETFKRVRDVLHALDVPQAQVIVEATILEVTINDALKYGVEWFLQSKQAGGAGSKLPISLPTGGSLASTGGDNGGGTFSIAGSIGNFNAGAVINALQGVTATKILSSPYLTVVDGSSARLQIGDQIPFLSNSSSIQNNNAGGTTSTTQQIEVKDTGIILEITPKVRSNNSVLLTINQQVSTPKSGGQELAPTISTRQIKSDILLQSGHTAFLGGIIQETSDKKDSGVPGLKTIPVVGNLFSQKSDSVTRFETVILITPRVIRNTSQMENITRLLHSKMYPNDLPR